MISGTQAVREVEPRLETPPMGLTQLEAERRLKQYGLNEIAGAERVSPIVEFFLEFTNPLILILVLAALLAAFFGQWLSSIIIVVVVVLSAALNFFNNYKSRRAADALRERVRITATVFRDAQAREIPLSQVVPGDVVALSPGDIVPADGRALGARDFFVNESSLTGESFPVEKRLDGALRMGTSVVTGSGLMLVVATGRQTEFSKVASALSRREEPTEFDRGMRDFSALIMKVTLLLVAAVFLSRALLHGQMLESFLFALALAVGLTPELLPMIITFTLAKGSLAMSRRGVIVKKLAAIQNFGGMDVLCTDKTGTLTENRITLVKHVDGLGNPSEDVFRYSYISSVYQSGFVSPLDVAVREFRTVDISAWRKIDEIPFDYVRRRESVVAEREGRLLITKGAPEEVLEACRCYGDGATPLDAELRERIKEEYRRLSGEGFRVLGVALKTLEELKDVYGQEDEREMAFLGFIAFFDPPKKTVAETLERIRRYGVEIKILTGDNEIITEKIARDIKLPVRGVLRGAQISRMNDQELAALAEETTVFSRVTPDQKMRIIELLRRSGHVIGYLGDGINDAPSLRAADVGISVNNAVDVAKESADIILLHKSLHDLWNGIIEGRKTFANTLKYLLMTLSSNFGNMFSMAGAALFLPFLPMQPSQILLNNLLYDSSQFAIPLDRVDRQSLRQPRKLDIAFIKRFMLVFGPLSSLFDFLTFVALFFVFRLTGSAFQSGWFLESLTTQVFVLYVIRSRHSPFLSSPPSMPILASTLGMVALGWLLVSTGLGRVFGFTPLPAGAALVILAIVGAYLVTVEMVKRRFYRGVRDTLA